MSDGAQTKKQKSEEKVQRLVKLFNQLNEEMDSLDKEGVNLRQELVSQLDQYKKLSLLKHIVNLPN